MRKERVALRAQEITPLQATRGRLEASSCLFRSRLMDCASEKFNWNFAPSLDINMIHSPISTKLTYANQPVLYSLEL